MKKLLKELKANKSSGPDNIQARFLKETAEELAPALSLLYQASIEQGHIPDDWRHAHVSPVFKKGEEPLL